MMKYTVSFLLPYLIGSISFSIIVTYFISKKDIRSMGSNNAGGTNVMRSMGKTAGISVMVLDILKCTVAVMIIRMLYGGNDPIFYCLAGLSCMLGHMFPLFFKFKGGKGVACGAGMVLAVDWRAFLILIGIFAIVLILSRYVSLASCLAAASYPISVFIFIISKTAYPVYAMLLAVLTGGMVIYMHRDNIKRLIKGTERRLGK